MHCDLEPERWRVAAKATSESRSYVPFSSICIPKISHLCCEKASVYSPRERDTERRPLCWLYVDRIQIYDMMEGAAAVPLALFDGSFYGHVPCAFLYFGAAHHLADVMHDHKPHIWPISRVRILWILVVLDM
jgi:hypothetical protein